LLFSAQSIETSLFSCNETQEEFSVPNIPDIYFNHSVAAVFRTGSRANLTGTGRFLSYLATIPVECSGSVQAIETCYQIRDGTYHSSPYIRFQVLEGTDNDYATVKSFEIVSTPTRASCAKTENQRQPNQIVCCENVKLKTESHFFISSGSNLTYGVTFLNNSNLRMLRFNQMLLYTQHRFLEQLPDVVNRMDLNSSTTVSTLLLLRMIVGKSRGMSKL